MLCPSPEEPRLGTVIGPPAPFVVLFEIKITTTCAQHRNFSPSKCARPHYITGGFADWSATQPIETIVIFTLRRQRRREKSENSGYTLQRTTGGYEIRRDVQSSYEDVVGGFADRVELSANARPQPIETIVIFALRR
jgi:hypothetical protein